jgi:cytochrome c556
MDLEQITKAAEAYAMNCWWQAHDEKNWEKVKDHIIISERVLFRYTGKFFDTNLVGDSFVEALKAYDTFTDILKKEGPYDSHNSKVAEGKLKEHLEKFYSALTGQKSSELASATTGWWASWAKSMMFYKLGNISEYENADRDLMANLTREHKIRFGFDEDTAKGLAYLMHAACNLGHNKRDWPKAKQLLKVYYTELLCNLNKQN